MADTFSFLNTMHSSFIPLLSGMPQQAYMPVDLSVSNKDLSLAILQDAQLHKDWINTRLSENGKQVAYGGYLEKRKLYERSTYFQSAETDEQRNIHLGVDLWCTAQTEVLSPLDGVIHSFQENTNYGDYGPTIILQHIVKDHIFYTLYGHLSKASLLNKKEGQKVHAGEVIAQLGTPDVNGNYAPHLHFQIIKDMQGIKGDYPGVCSTKNLEFYKNNCPDPNFLLNIKLAF